MQCQSPGKSNFHTNKKLVTALNINRQESNNWLLKERDEIDQGISINLNSGILFYRSSKTGGRANDPSRI